MRILSTRRGRTTLALSAAALAMFIVPWHGNVRAPAVLTPAQSSEVFPPAAAKVNVVHVKNGQSVKAGDKLITLSAPQLNHDKNQAQKRLGLIDAQMNRSAANLAERRFGATLIEARAKEVGTLTGIDRLQNQLIVRAAHDGVVSELPETLHEGRYLMATDRVMRLVGRGTQKVIILPADYQLSRLREGNPIRFIADDPFVGRVNAAVSNIAPTSVTAIDYAEMTSIGGGPVAVTEDATGTLIPETQIFRIDAKPADTDLTVLRVTRGTAHIKAARQSPAKALWRSVMGVLIRETDF